MVRLRAISIYPAEKETSNKLRARWVISKEKEPLEQFHYTLIGQLSTLKIDLFHMKN